MNQNLVICFKMQIGSTSESVDLDVKHYLANLLQRALAEAEKSYVDLPDRTSVIDHMSSCPQMELLFSSRQFTLRHLARQCYYGIVAVIFGYQGVQSISSMNHNLLAMCFRWLKLHARTKIRLT